MSKKEISIFLLFTILLYFAYTVFLIYSGYFEIGLMSDDYTNFISAESSTLKQKITSSVPYYSTFHLRPIWFLSINFSIWLNNLMDISKDNFILFRVENLILFYVLIILAAATFIKITKNFILAAVLMLMCLIYPNNINDICWGAGKVDLLCGLFMVTSAFFAFSDLQDKSAYKKYISGAFFALALLTKETSVILPFILALLVYLSYGKEKLFEAKSLLLMMIIMLLIYFSYRVYILGVQPVEVITKFQKPGLLSVSTVIFKAFISLIFPYDYLSFQQHIREYNLLFTVYSFLMLLFIIAVLFIFIRTGNIKYIILLSLGFLILISPNLIAGYFRPQLILIPFMFMTFFLLLTAWKLNVSLKFYAVILFLILIIWGRLSFNLIQDWKLAYNKSVVAINKLIDLNIDTNKRNVILGLPSRYKQAYMLDYASGPYNYWKYKKFEMTDKLDDLVLTGSLDPVSLNSELYIYYYTDMNFEIVTLGETQYFLRLDAAGLKYKDSDIAFRLTEKNPFKKPTILGLRIKTENSDVYIYSNDEFIKLDKPE